MEAFSERLLREHQPAWQAMQQHPFVTEINFRKGHNTPFFRWRACLDCW